MDICIYISVRLYNSHACIYLFILCIKQGYSIALVLLLSFGNKVGDFLYICISFLLIVIQKPNVSNVKVCVANQYL